MILYASLALGALAAALLVYRYDLYDREPWPLLALSVGLGAGAMSLLGVLETRALLALPVLQRGPGPALLAAVVEETAKLLVVLAIAFGARRHFNDPIDGLIYGSLAGLGAALEESLAYLRAGLPTGLLPGSELVRLAGHLVMGGIAGYGVGFLTTESARRRAAAAIAASLSGAVALHFLWDWVALWPAAGSYRRWQAAGAVALMLAGLLAYGMLVARGSEVSRQQFDARRASGLWGWPFRRAGQDEGGTEGNA